MPVIKEAYWRDANNIPITTDGLITTDDQTLVANNTTAHVPIFTIQGSIEVRALYAEVLTVLGANHTAASFRVNDQTNQSQITSTGGTTLNAAPVGSLITKKDLASAAVTLLSASQERVSEPTTLENDYFSRFTITALPGAVTNIEYNYTTTDTPTSGKMRFYLKWLPLTTNANVITL